MFNIILDILYVMRVALQSLTNYLLKFHYINLPSLLNLYIQMFGVQPLRYPISDLNIM